MAGVRALKQMGFAPIPVHECFGRPRSLGRVGKGALKVETVRASCPGCGDVELTTRDVTVQMCSATEEGTYSFVCPTCRLIVNKPAETRVIELLVSAGVRVVNWDLPAELYEPKSGPPITYDDLLAFHFELDSDNWLEQVISAGGGSR